MLHACSVPAGACARRVSSPRTNCGDGALHPSWPRTPALLPWWPTDKATLTQRFVSQTVCRCALGVWPCVCFSCCRCALERSYLQLGNQECCTRAVLVSVFAWPLCTSQSSFAADICLRCWCGRNVRSAWWPTDTATQGVTCRASPAFWRPPAVLAGCALSPRTRCVLAAAPNPPLCVPNCGGCVGCVFFLLPMRAGTFLPVTREPRVLHPCRFGFCVCLAAVQLTIPRFTCLQPPFTYFALSDAGPAYSVDARGRPTPQRCCRRPPAHFVGNIASLHSRLAATFIAILGCLAATSAYGFMACLRWFALTRAAGTPLLF
jgi:hypothetical protein